jgi:hypothetical protein
MLSITSLANNTVTRNGTLTVVLDASEPVASFLVLQSHATEWTKKSATAGGLMLTADGEGQQQAALKGGNSTATCG